MNVLVGIHTYVLIQLKAKFINFMRIVTYVTCYCVVWLHNKRYLYAYDMLKLMGVMNDWSYKVGIGMTHVQEQPSLSSAPPTLNSLLISCVVLQIG